MSDYFDPFDADRPLRHPLEADHSAADLLAALDLVPPPGG